MSNINPFRLARKLLRKYHIGDPFIIAEREGIQIVYVNDLKTTRGSSAIILGVRFIFLNRLLSRQMAIMVCAHELGHLLLHKKEYRNLPNQQWLLNHELFDIKDELEYEANQFAANLLLDSGEIIECAENGFTRVQIAREMNVNVNLLLIKIDEMNAFEHANIPDIDKPGRDFLGTVKDDGCFDEECGYYPDPEYDD